MLFLLCSHLRVSFVSAVFDFNASLNDVAPVFLMLFSVDNTHREFVKTAFVINSVFN